MAEIALAAGFGSVRRFNEVFQKLFRRPPSTLRRKTSVSSASQEAEVTLRLRYRPPYDWDSMLAYLQARAIPGVEVVENGSYWRTVEIDGFTGSIEVKHLPQRQNLGVTLLVVRSVPPGVCSRSWQRLHQSQRCTVSGSVWQKPSPNNRKTTEHPVILSQFAVGQWQFYIPMRLSRQKRNLLLSVDPESFRQLWLLPLCSPAC